MFSGVTAEAFLWASAGGSLVWGFTTLVAPSILAAELYSVAESLTFEAAHGVWNENFDVVPDVTGEQGRRQGGRLEGQYEQTGVASLPVPEGGQTAYV